MVMCQYYLQGRCRFGNSCRFEHSYNSYQDDRGNRNSNTNTGNSQANNIAWQIAKEVIAAEKGGQWPLSCFSPFKEGPCLPGWEDVSPEEVRWTLYEAQKSGTVSQCLNQINQLHSNAERARNSLKQPTPETIRMINDILAGKKVLTPTNSSSTSPNAPLTARSNPFETTNNSFRFDGAAASNTNIFGGGSSPNYPSQNVFGNADNASQNIFSNTQQPNQNIFSNANQNVFSSSNQNIFSTPQSPTSTSNQNIFSTPQNPTSPTNQNIFSTPQSPNANQNIFSNAQPPSQNIFSTPNNIFNNSGNVNSFSSSNSIFGGGSQPNEAPNFGNVFGGTQNIPQANPGYTQEQTGFVNFQPPSNSNIFERQTEINQVQTGSIQTDSSCYSNVDDLTDDEKGAFTSPTFAFGKIPMKPPAQEFC